MSDHKEKSMRDVAGLGFMFVNVLLALVGLLLLGSGAGVALAQAVTPSPTWEPLYKTPTPEPTQSYTCASGRPVGWGTVTPSYMWSVQCADCLLTMTSYTTMTPWPSMTPGPGTPTVTPGPSATSTITLTPTTQAFSLVLTSPQNYKGSDPYCGANGSAYSMTLGATVDTWDYSGIYQFKDNHDWQLHSDMEYAKWSYSGSGSVPWSVTVNQRLSLEPWAWKVLRNGAVVAQGQSSASGFLELGPTLGTGNVEFQLTRECTNLPFTGLAFDGDISFKIGRGALGIPTPTPTAMPSGYCKVVDPGGIGTPADISDLPNVIIGPATCAGFGPFTIGLSSLNWLPGVSFTDVTVPNIEVCFRPIQFGTVRIFGMAFDLDILSSVITGVLAIRWLFRS